MFQGLRQNSLFYILEKGEKPNLKIGQVVSVSNPQQKFPTYIAEQPMNMETTVDVKVQVDNEQMDFQKLPALMQIANFGNGIVVSESKEAMCSEVDALLRQSKAIVESVDYHRNVISACDRMLAQLNPQIAKEKQQEQDISNLKSDVNGMKGTINDIRDMLQKALNGSNIKK